VPGLRAHAALAAVTDTVERFADRLATDDELRDANREADGIYDRAGEAADASEAAEGLSENTVRRQAIHRAAPAAYWASRPEGSSADIGLASALAADAVGLALAGRDYDVTQVEGHAAKERAIQARLLRDIVGNPFRPVDFPVSWRTGTAVAVARH